jgi:transcriptional regulator with XRE-family HTH domain
MRIYDVLPRPPAVPVLLSEAIRACYADRLTQDQLAEATGIPQSTISRLARGDTEPRLDVLKRIEEACGRPAGWIVIQAGYVADVKTVPEAIAVDPALVDDHARRSVLKAYAGVVKNYHPISVEELRQGGPVGAAGVDPLGHDGA